MSPPMAPSISVELDRQQISYLLCVLLTAPDDFADHLIALLAAAYRESLRSECESEPLLRDYPPLHAVTRRACIPQVDVPVAAGS